VTGPTVASARPRTAEIPTGTDGLLAPSSTM